MSFIENMIDLLKLTRHRPSLVSDDGYSIWDDDPDFLDPLAIEGSLIWLQLHSEPTAVASAPRDRSSSDSAPSTPSEQETASIEGRPSSEVLVNPLVESGDVLDDANQPSPN